MKKIIFLPILAISLFLLAPQAQASVEADFTVHEIAAYDIIPGAFEQLVLDVTIPNNKISGDDELKAITVRNNSTARERFEISKIKIWADDDEAGFQGLGRDIELGEAIWTTNSTSWTLSNLSQAVPQSGLRIFVSLDSKRTIDNNKGVKFYVPVYLDNDSDGEYDAGDLGIFMASEDNGATDAELMNSDIIFIKAAARDTQAPKTAITDPLDGAIITSDTYTIKGQALEQGSSSMTWLKVKINDSWYEVERLTADYATWQYEWTDLVDGTYTLEAIGLDSRGNQTEEGNTITVTVSSSDPEPEPEPEPEPDPEPEPEVVTVSSAYSTFGVNLYSQKADGLSAVRATIYVKDSEEQSLSGVEVSVSASRGLKDTITTSNNVSDSNGKVQFDIKSNTKGVLTLSASAQGLSIGVPQEIVFVNPLAYPTKTLVKQTDKPAVYLFEKGKLRAFPSAEVFLSAGHQWSDIEKIGDLSDFPIDDNVKYPDGYLIKGSGDKVYLISNGEKRWISTGEVFVGLGYKWGDIKIITDTLISEYSTGVNIDTFDKRPDGTLIKYSSSDKVYVIKDGKKKWIESIEEFINGGYKWEDIKIVEESEIYEDY